MHNKEKNDVDLNLRQYKDFFYDDTYMNLINCLDAYEKNDYMSFIVWAAVFNERLLNDLAQFFNPKTKSQSTYRLEKIIKDRLGDYSVEEQAKYITIIKTIQIVQRYRNEAVHNPISANKATAMETYGALIVICTYYTDTKIARRIYREHRDIIDESHETADKVSLQLTNIGKISNAVIKIDGLTVLVGENSTGKSTLGRALFLITKSFRNMESSVLESQRRKIKSEIISLLRRMGISSNVIRTVDVEEISKALTTCPPANVQRVFLDNLPDRLKLFFGEKGHRRLPELNKTIQNIQDIRDLSYSDLSKQVVTNEISTLFAGKICKIGTNSGKIELKYDDGSENTIIIQRNDNGDECIDLIQNQDISALSCMMEPLDDNFRINDFDSSSGDVIDSFYAKEATSKFENILSELIQGRIIISKHKVSFEEKGLNELVEVKNLSSGVKTIAALEWKLRIGEIGRDSVLILDEPEVSLHPEWQIKYAQIIVQLQKALNLHILIMTHSPYFLQALEYSAKLGGLGDKYHCYLAESNNDITRISCVDKYPSYAYKKMIEPFAELDIMREKLENITNENGV